MSPLSGTQVHLTRGAQSATLATVGASLREYTVGGADVVVPFAADEVAHGTFRLGEHLLPPRNILGKGHDVTFAADTPIQVRLAPGPSPR